MVNRFFLYLNLIIFKLAGGGGLSNANKVDVKEMFNIKKLKPIVDKCIAIVQSIKRWNY